MQQCCKTIIILVFLSGSMLTVQFNVLVGSVKLTRDSDLGVLEEGVFFNPLYEHEAVLAVSGPVKKVLHQVLMVDRKSVV